MRPLSLCILLAVFSSNSFANDLLMVYQDAWQNSPLLKNYQATNAAAAETVPIAAAALLPQVAVTANTTKSWLNLGGQNLNYPSSGFNISLTQPLFNYSNYAGLAGALDNRQAAAATCQSNTQNFTLTVAQDYFNVILAAENVSYAEAEQNALQKTEAQTRARFSAGLATYADVTQARANEALAVATVLVNQNNLVDADQSLAALTGKPEVNLATLKNNFPFTPPLPDDINAWVAKALQNNQNLLAQHYSSRAALAAVNQTVGDQLPTVSFVATYNKNYYHHDVPAVISNSTSPSGLTLALQFSWNIFTGGTQMATSLQAANKYASAENAELNVYRQLIMQTRQDFLSVRSNIARVSAYQATVLSATTSLQNYNAEYKAGTVAILEVLNATETLYQAKTNLAQAENAYILSLLQLKYDAGDLTLQDIDDLNQYLQVHSKADVRFS